MPWVFLLDGILKSSCCLLANTFFVETCTRTGTLEIFFLISLSRGILEDGVAGPFRIPLVIRVFF